MMDKKNRNQNDLIAEIIYKIIIETRR